MKNRKTDAGDLMDYAFYAFLAIITLIACYLVMPKDVKMQACLLIYFGIIITASAVVIHRCLIHVKHPKKNRNESGRI